MPFYPVKRDRTSKPPVGTPLRTDGHWSVQGLDVYMGMHAGSLSQVESVSRKVFSPENAAGATCDQDGYNSGAPDGAYNLGLVRSPLADYTCIAGVLLADIPVGDPPEGMAAILGHIGQEEGGRRIFYFSEAGLSLVLSHPAGGGDSGLAAFDSIPLGASIVVAGVYRESLRQCNVYVGGKDVTYMSGSEGASGGWNTDELSLSIAGIFYYDSYFGSSASLFIKWVAQYSRALTANQVKSLSENPWQIFEPEVTWISTGGVTATLNQYSFRFFNDDGSESAATAKAGINTSINLSAGDIARIRFLLDATGDPVGKQFQLEYRHKPSGGSFGPWTKV